MSRDNLSDTEMYFTLFDMERDARGEHHAPTWPLYRSDENIRLIKERAASYKTLPSISGFIRAFNELRAEGAIKPVRSSDPFKVAAEEVLTADQYNKMPASQIVVRYRSDPEFKAGVDSLIARGLI